jgi:hypothetical protein
MHEMAVSCSEQDLDDGLVRHSAMMDAKVADGSNRHAPESARCEGSDEISPPPESSFTGEIPPLGTMHCPYPVWSNNINLLILNGLQTLPSPLLVLHSPLL